LCCTGQGYAHNLVETKRFQPVTSSFLRAKGARFYCWILPGEDLLSSTGSETWKPCPHGGFAYLFGDIEMTEDKVLTNFDPRSCVFPATVDDSGQSDHVSLTFPKHLGRMGVVPITLRPFLNMESMSYQMPTSIVGWLSAQGARRSSFLRKGHFRTQHKATICQDRLGTHQVLL
jgi:hypothetical protein